MTYIIVGLGNPGPEYTKTRHNVGRMVVEAIAQSCMATEWRVDKKLRAQVASGKMPAGNEVLFVLPENYMNRSGDSVRPLMSKAVDIERLIIVHDDIDLPIGQIRIVHDRGAGGHNGVLSIEHVLKTRAFTRVRVGVIPTTPTGRLRKPKGAEAVHAFILTPLTPKGLLSLEGAITRAVRATHTIIEHGRDVAMAEFNGHEPATGAHAKAIDRLTKEV